MPPTKEQQIAAIQKEMAEIREKIIGNSNSEETRNAFKQLEALAKRIAAMKTQ